MSGYELHPAAHTDLDGITEYIIEHGSPAAAHRVVDELFDGHRRAGSVPPAGTDPTGLFAGENNPINCFFVVNQKHCLGHMPLPGPYPGTALLSPVSVKDLGPHGRLRACVRDLCDRGDRECRRIGHRGGSQVRHRGPDGPFYDGTTDAVLAEPVPVAQADAETEWPAPEQDAEPDASPERGTERPRSDLLRQLDQAPLRLRCFGAGRLAYGSFALRANLALDLLEHALDAQRQACRFGLFGLSEFHQCRAESTYRGLHAHAVAAPGLHAQKCNPPAIIIGPLGGEFPLQLERVTHLVVSTSGPEEVGQPEPHFHLEAAAIRLGQGGRNRRRNKGTPLTGAGTSS